MMDENKPKEISFCRKQNQGKRGSGESKGAKAHRPLMSSGVRSFFANCPKNGVFELFPGRSGLAGPFPA
jgi:hypothetical protein